MEGVESAGRIVLLLECCARDVKMPRWMCGLEFQWSVSPISGFWIELSLRDE